MTILSIKARRCIEAGVSALADPARQATWRIWARNHRASSHPPVIPCVVLDVALAGLTMRIQALQAKVATGTASPSIEAELTFATAIHHRLLCARREAMMEPLLSRTGAHLAHHPRHPL
jgi:hypothetical protein